MRRLRYFIRFSYNGTRYHGWQSQPNALSVQEVLTTALSTVLQQPISLTGAGRTDTGVHATMMYAHFDVESDLAVATLVHRLNAFLPEDIAVIDLLEVHSTAHARFDATSRTYEYHIHTFKSPFLQNRSWYFSQKLELQAMNEAASLLLDHTDFECFSKVHTEVHTFNCKISLARWEQNGNSLIFTITADRFLRNMVRAIVGTLIGVGLGKISLDDFKKILESRNRSEAGFSVPAHGLYLTDIRYDYPVP